MGLNNRLKGLLAASLSLGMVFFFSDCRRGGEKQGEAVNTLMLVSQTPVDCKTEGRLTTPVSTVTYTNMKGKTYTLTFTRLRDGKTMGTLTGVWTTKSDQEHSFSFNIRHIPRNLYRVTARIEGAESKDGAHTHTQNISGEIATADLGCEGETVLTDVTSGTTTDPATTTQRQGLVGDIVLDTVY